MCDLVSHMRKAIIAVTVLIVLFIVPPAGESVSTEHETREPCIEIDAISEERAMYNASDRLEQIFSEHNVSLNVTVDDTDAPHAADIDDVRQISKQYRDSPSCYYVFVTNNVTDVQGITSGDIAMIQNDDPTHENETMSTLMHETGHLMGLDDDMAGVDSYRYNETEYNSIMNYSSGWMLDYSDGDDKVGRDEWELIRELHD